MWALTDAARQVSFTGTDHYLRPNAALYVGLALHELAVNAAQYGAFSRSHGRVDIVVTKLAGGAASEDERPGVPVMDPAHGDAAAVRKPKKPWSARPK